jgi:hypothetical protein
MSILAEVRRSTMAAGKDPAILGSWLRSVTATIVHERMSDRNPSIEFVEQSNYFDFRTVRRRWIDVAR